MPTAVKRDPEVLKKAANILQAAHDYIEVHGFDIQSYVPVDGQCCYIGNVRLAAGVDPDSDMTHEADAGEGDGEELYAALEALDGVARRRLDTERREEAQRFISPAGRYVEQLGFQIEKKAEEKFIYPEQDPTETFGEWMDRTEAIDQKRIDFQRDYALKLLRTALTRIYK